jgi:hypothetical protein
MMSAARGPAARWRARLFFAVLAAPSLAAVGWSIWPSMKALIAVASFNPSHIDRATPGPADGALLTDDEWLDAQRTVELRREIQRHFREHDIYIPLEDIVTPASMPAGPDDLPLLMQKACGQGKLYVWIPYKINLPVVGEKVFEWCWKPRIKTP